MVFVQCNATLLNEIYQPTKFLVEISCSFRVIFWTKFKVEKLTTGNKTKIRHGRVTVLEHCTSINEIYSPTKFLVDTCCSFRVMSRTKFKSVKNGQRTKAPTFGKAV